jgi:hypothetical protein
MKSKTDAMLVDKIIKRYGPVIDLRSNPQTIIDILRTISVDDPPDGGTPCGGVPNPPPPPPGSRFEGEVTNEDLMKAVLKLSRDLSTVKTTITSKAATAKAAKSR